jgi:hypothetical protein
MREAPCMEVNENAAVEAQKSKSEEIRRQIEIVLC